MDIRFDGKRALVTGAGKGIGKAVALRLVECGAEVVALSRTQADLEELKKLSPSIRTVCCDVGDWAATRDSLQDVGPVQLLVNNAAILETKEYGSYTEEDVDRILNINMKSIINITQTLVSGMKARGEPGSVVNVSSMLGIQSSHSYGVHSASKAAVDQLTRSMGIEYGPHRIRVNSVNPSVVRTPMAVQLGYFEDTNASANAMKERTPLRRFAEIEDVVYPILFLLSEQASMITGITLPIDGGLACNYPIGKGVALKLVECGAEVVALSRTQSDLDELEKLSPSIRTVCCDVGDWAATHDSLQDVGPVQLLVNNAGILETKEYGSYTEEDVDRTMNINMKSIINITQTVVRAMIDRGEDGAVVNVSSIYGLQASHSYGVYCASKGAVDQLTRSMAIEFGPHNIRVNSVNPTSVRTRMALERGFFLDTHPKEVAMKQRTPLRRFAEIEDVVSPVLFLLSEKASMITGITLPVDGGLACNYP